VWKAFKVEGEQLPTAGHVVGDEHAQRSGTWGRGRRGIHVFHHRRAWCCQVAGERGQVYGERDGSPLGAAVDVECTVAGGDKFPRPRQGDGAPAFGRAARARVGDGEEQVSGVGAVGHTADGKVDGALVCGADGAFHQQPEGLVHALGVSFVDLRKMGGHEPRQGQILGLGAFLDGVVGVAQAALQVEDRPA